MAPSRTTTMTISCVFDLGWNQGATTAGFMLFLPISQVDESFVSFDPLGALRDVLDLRNRGPGDVLVREPQVAEAFALDDPVELVADVGAVERAVRRRVLVGA